MELGPTYRFFYQSTTPLPLPRDRSASRTNHRSFLLPGRRRPTCSQGVAATSPCFTLSAAELFFPKLLATPLPSAPPPPSTLRSSSEPLPGDTPPARRTSLPPAPASLPAAELSFPKLPTTLIHAAASLCPEAEPRAFPRRHLRAGPCTTADASVAEGQGSGTFCRATASLSSTAVPPVLRRPWRGGARWLRPARSAPPTRSAAYGGR